MSQLRLGRLPDGTRHVVVLEPAVGRITHARYAIHGAAVNPVIAGAFVSGSSDTQRRYDAARRDAHNAERRRSYRSRAK